MSDIEKGLLRDTPRELPAGDQQHRGIMAYSASVLQTATGRARTGQTVTGEYQQPLFYLTISERNQIFELCAPVFGLVTARMNRVASLDWKIVPKRKDEERLVAKFRDAYELVKEYGANETSQILIRGLLYREVCRELRELKNDWSNFEKCLMRFRRRLMDAREDRAQEITDWLEYPNVNDTFPEFVKKYVKDLLVHGTGAIFKEKDDIRNTLENFYCLPGGSVIPLRPSHPGGYEGYIQIFTDLRENQIFFQDEISFSTYLPDSAKWYGNVPLESLINQVAEYLMTNQRMANEADGTKPPEKAVVFGENNPFGSLDGDLSIKDVPMAKAEQERIELKINEARKNAIMTLTGVGTPIVLDLSRENIMPLFTERQKVLTREAIAMAFNVSPGEMGIVAGEGLDSTGSNESQERIDQAKGVQPILMTLSEVVNRDILPYRFGSDFVIEFAGGVNENARLDTFIKELQVGTTINELRDKMNRPRFDDEAYDRPTIPGSGAAPAGGVAIQ